MHEHGLADHILQVVLQHPNRPGDSHPAAVTVLVAELGGLSQAALQTALDHVCEHEGLPHLELELRTAELLGECDACGRTSEVTVDLTCPVCHAGGVRLCGGETVIVEACRYG